MSTIKAQKIQPPVDSDALQIFTNATERMNISSGGLVGIGTVSAGSLLHVGGTALITGAASLSSTLTVGSATMAVPSGTAPIFGARAWVTFNGFRDTTGVVSATATNRQLLSSGNVASVMRLSAGIYEIVFTTAMPNANYVAVAMCAGFQSGNYSGNLPCYHVTTASGENALASKTASKFTIINSNSSTAQTAGIENSHVSVVVFG